MTIEFRKNVISDFTELLDSLGFKRKGLLWCRTENIFVDLIDVQSSRFDNSFAVNLGILIPIIRNDLFGPDLKVVCAANGIIEARLGVLAFHGHDHWWSKDSKQDIRDAASKLLQYGMAFLNKYHFTDHMIEHLQREAHDRKLTFPKSFYLALLNIHFGDKNKGRAILQRIALQPHAQWNESVGTLLQKYEQK